MKYRDNDGLFKNLFVKTSDTLPIGTIVEYDGTEVPNGYEKVDNGEVLWTNPDTSINFETQTITLANSAYDYYSILWKISTTANNYLNTGEIPKGFGSQMSYISGGSADSPIRTRSINYETDTSIKFGSGYTGTAATSTLDDKYCIPYKVIGYKKNAIKKIEQSIGVVGKVLNDKTESSKDTYSCNYINNTNKYATEEVKTNETWIDGKPIYRKVVNFKSTTSPYQYAHGISNIDTVVKWEGYTLRGDETTPFRTISTYTTTYPEYFVTLDSVSKTNIEILAGNNAKNSITWFITVYYTKTTDEVSA